MKVRKRKIIPVFVCVIYMNKLHLWIRMHRWPYHVRVLTETFLDCESPPLGCSLFPHSCSPIHSTNTIVKFINSATVVGLITDNESVHMGEVRPLTERCSANNLG